MTTSMAPSDRRRAAISALALAGIIALAFALRFWRLGEWNFQATEIFTLRDSLTLKLRNPRPLGYLLNYYLVRPFRPLDEFGLRLLPALFGALAVPAFYSVARRLIGTRAALFGTLFVAVSPLLVLYSQLARYWSLVFLFCVIYPYALYLGLRDRNARALAIGLVAAVLAALAHPVSVLLFGGLAIWFLAANLRPGYLSQLWSQKSVRWAALVAAVLAGVMLVRFVPVLQSWIAEHDKNPGSGQFLLRPKPAPGVKQLIYISAFVESLTLPLVLTAVGGIYLLWQEKDRTLALLLTCLAGFPLVFLSLISIRTPVSTYYLLPAVPVFFIGAGVFLDRVADTAGGISPRWLLPAVLAAMVIAAGLPTMISDFRDGRRYDFRGAAHWLEPSLAPGDVVFSDQHMVLAHYLPSVPVQRLRPDSASLAQSLRELRQSGQGQAVWIVAPAPSHAFRTNLKAGGLLTWIFDNCRVRHTRGVGRVDFRQEYLQVYRCPAGPVDPGPAEAATSK